MKRPFTTLYKNALKAMAYSALAACLPVFAFAQKTTTSNADTWDWVRKGSGCSYDRTNSLSNDICGHIYAVGSFHDTAGFTNQGTNRSFHLTSNGGRDGFLAQYNEDGRLLWVANMGGALEDETWDVSSFCGSVFVAGYFQGTMTVKSAAGSGGPNKVLVSAGQKDMFLAKYDDNGKVVWAVRNGSTGNDEAWAAQLSTDHRLFVGGSFEGTVPFKGVVGGTHSQTSRGKGDGFVCEVNAENGSMNRSMRFGGTGNDVVYGINALFSSTFICGTFEGTATGDAFPNGMAAAYSHGMNDAFIASLANNGKIEWVRSWGGTGSDVARRLSLAIDNTISAAGYFNSASFTIGSKTITSAGMSDAMVVKYSTDGAFKWANRFGGPLDDEARDIVTDLLGFQYVVGYFQGSATDIAGHGRTSYGNKDILVWRLNLLGESQWFERAGGTNDDQGRCVALSGLTCVAGGMYFRNAVFGPDGVPDKRECGNGGAFVGKVEINWSSSREGVTEPTRALSLILAPNPATSSLAITLAGNDQTQAVHLYDTQGRMVMETTIAPEAPSAMNVSTLPRGIYMVEVAGQRQRVVLQ